jgi:predicted transcriptional regulator
MPRSRNYTDGAIPHAEIGKRFGCEVRKARWRRDLTQGQLAAQTKLSQGLISMVETGDRCPKLSTALILAKFLTSD